MQKPFISAIHQNSPAEKYELKIGDRIIDMDNTTVEDNLQKIKEVSQAIPLKETTITIERDGKILTKTIIMGSKEEEAATVGFLGVEFDNAPIPPHSFMDAIKEGISATNTWIKNTIIGFTQLKKNRKNIGGPIMIIAATTKAAASGFKIFILLLAIISINLAVLNIIPLPVLDGGQMLFYSIEALIRRPIPNKVREYIHVATWLFFIVLIIYLSAQDIIRIASPYLTPVLQYMGFKS
jgi:regulator of sigma E protease